MARKFIVTEKQRELICNLLKEDLGVNQNRFSDSTSSAYNPGWNSTSSDDMTQDVPSEIDSIVKYLSEKLGGGFDFKDVTRDGFTMISYQGPQETYKFTYNGDGDFSVTGNFSVNSLQMFEYIQQSIEEIVITIMEAKREAGV